MMVDTPDDNAIEDNMYWGHNQDSGWEPENDQGLQQYASLP